MKLLTLPDQRSAAGVRIRLRRRSAADAGSRTRAPTSSGRTTCSTATARRASRRNGGCTWPAAPGSSPSAIPPPTGCCAPTCTARGRHECAAAARRRRVDRPFDSSSAFEFEGRALSRVSPATRSRARCWAAGVRVLGRSFKYHRPRGVLSLANHDVNALFQDGATTQPARRRRRRCARHAACGGQHLRRRRSTTVRAFSTGCPRFCRSASTTRPFIRRRRWFPFWERMFRRMTGLGELDFSTPRIRTPKRYDFCDVLVIGAGPSGLSRRARGGGGRREVVLVDENARAGGSLTYQRGGSDDRAVATCAICESQCKRASEHQRAHRHAGGRLLRRPLGGAGRRATA